MCNKRSGTVGSSSGNTTCGISTNEVFLPREILVEILTRLPAKMVGQCKCICKHWRALMEEPSFVELHHFRAKYSRPDGCYLLICSFTNEDAIFSSTDQEGGVARHSFNHQLPVSYFSSYFSLTSVNGLICFDFMASESIFVANPITKEIVCLPPFSASSSRAFRHMAVYLNYSKPLVSFGFDPSTKQFKVLNIHRILKQSSTHEERWEFSHCECEIFTLGGSHSWRKIDIVPPASHVKFGNEEGICVGGVIHWGIFSESSPLALEVVVAFDLKDEKFRVMSLPRGPTRMCRLVDIGGHLAACEEFPVYEQPAELWVLEDYDNWVWVKKSIMLPLDRYALRKYIRTMGSIQTGDILLYDEYTMRSSSLEIYYYGRNKTSLRKIDITGLPYGEVESIYYCAENLFSLQGI